MSEAELKVAFDRASRMFGQMGPARTVHAALLLAHLERLSPKWPLPPDPLDA
ncbi:hypothetical protein [Nocardia otitidiscaviarum]|uniref:hypothetical protein n=1 Tax=Nocardia otitidiscaviarum TaxID=1823 RepID=UPI00130DBBB5|nr:hypothetical protein [Nocardia otitidiscaviarum]